MSATVLVVDDEPKLRHLVRDYLERDGYAVLQASTGQRALELGPRAPPWSCWAWDCPTCPAKTSHGCCASAIAVIVLTAKADEASRVAGLQHAAYVGR